MTIPDETILMWVAALTKRLQRDAKLSRPSYLAYLHYFEAVAHGIAGKC